MRWGIPSLLIRLAASCSSILKICDLDSGLLPHIDYTSLVVLLKNFAMTSNLFCGATGALCFRLWLTLPMGFKARVDPSSPMFCSHLHVMIPRVNSKFPNPRPVPILQLGAVRLPLEWPPNVASRITGRGKIRTQNLAVRCSTNTSLVGENVATWMDEW